MLSAKKSYLPSINVYNYVTIKLFNLFEVSRMVLRPIDVRHVR